MDEFKEKSFIAKNPMDEQSLLTTKEEKTHSNNANNRNIRLQSPGELDTSKIGQGYSPVLTVHGQWNKTYTCPPTQLCCKSVISCQIKVDRWTDISQERR
jgi:hypothetical protein